MPSYTALKQSRLGIASFILSLLAPLLFFGNLSLFGRYIGLVEFFYVLLAALLIALVAFILGIIGLIQTKRKKAFAWAGTVLSVIAITVAVSYVIHLSNTFVFR